MALEFLNKKGWHTGSLSNIENVWKAVQNHEAEQKKLEELRKQIHEERECSEFRQLQEQADLIPKQERLDFLYESGLAIEKETTGFKALESLPKNDPENTSPFSSIPNSASATSQVAKGTTRIFMPRKVLLRKKWTDKANKVLARFHLFLFPKANDILLDYLNEDGQRIEPTWTMIDNMIKEGKIIPSEVTIKLLQRAIQEYGNNKFLINGFHRNEENRSTFESVVSLQLYLVNSLKVKYESFFIIESCFKHSSRLVVLRALEKEH